MIAKLKQHIIRNFYFIFFKKDCIQFFIPSATLYYGLCLFDGTNHFKCLGNNYFKIIKNKKP